jgi:hypothetical protein
MKYRLFAVLVVLGLHAKGQSAIDYWPTTAKALIAGSELPLSGKLNGKLLYYFNLNENGWDSVYIFNQTQTKVKQKGSEGFEKHISNINSPQYRQVEYINSMGIKYAAYAVNRRDSTYTTFYPNGKVRTRHSYSNRGHSSFTASESHHRYEDYYHYNDGKLKCDLIKDTIIHGYPAIYKAKIDRNDTTHYEISEANGHVWLLNGEDGRVDYQLAGSDTAFRIQRDRFRRHLWWTTDSICDTLWYQNGHVQIKKQERNTQTKLTYWFSPTSDLLVTQNKMGNWGEEEEYYQHTDLAIECISYSYYTSATTHVKYTYPKNITVLTEHKTFTPSGKLKQITRLEGGEIRTINCDTNLSNNYSHCGTRVVTELKPLPKHFSMRLDSIVTENGKVAEIDPSELLLRTSYGWLSWPQLVKQLEADCQPFFEAGQQQRNMIWRLKNGQLGTSAFDEFDWMCMPSGLSLADLCYKGVSWNDQAATNPFDLAVYFQLTKPEE